MQRPTRRRDVSMRRTGRRPAERNNANADAARLPRIISAICRGQLGITKPSRPRGSFLLLGPTGALGKQKRWSWQPIMFSAKESCSASTCRNFKIKKHWAFSSVRGSRPLIAPHRKHDAAEGTIIPYCAVRISAVAYSRRSASGSGECCSRSQSRSSRLEVVKSPGMIREAACVNS